MLLWVFFLTTFIILSCLCFITMLLYMHKYIVSHIYMTCIYDFLGYYTLSGMTVSENRARSKCFLNNFNMKANRNRCLLNICCDRHCTNFDTSFLHIGSLPGVFLWRGCRGRAQMIAPAVFSSSQSGSPVHCPQWSSCSRCWYTFPLELACLTSL